MLYPKKRNNNNQSSSNNNNDVNDGAPQMRLLFLVINEALNKLHYSNYNNTVESVEICCLLLLLYAKRHK